MWLVSEQMASYLSVGSPTPAALLVEHMRPSWEFLSSWVMWVGLKRREDGVGPGLGGIYLAVLETETAPI